MQTLTRVLQAPSSFVVKVLFHILGLLHYCAVLNLIIDQILMTIGDERIA
jgi:hypothetical protein